MKTYFKGDAAEYTGNSEMLHGQMFYEVRLIEGHLTGQTKLVKTAPSAEGEFYFPSDIEAAKEKRIDQKELTPEAFSAKYPNV